MNLAVRPQTAVAGLPAENRPEIVLDLSRLLSRVLHTTPTGVDRVEMAYAQMLRELAPERISFAATHPAGWSGRLRRDEVSRFLAATAERWEREGDAAPPAERWAYAAAAAARLLPLPGSRRRRPAVYLHLSARSLERTGMFRSILRRENARFVPFVHDLIPLQHPEYARPDGPAMYQRKIATVTALADGVIVNSNATAEALAPYFDEAGRTVPMHVAPLAPAFEASGPAPAPARPYFVTLGTIEPRKNHMLLLQVWRRLVETRGKAATPRLLVLGRRGWENENILDLLDRCPALRGVVEEKSRLSDLEVRTLIAGASAVLMPSFAEGYGLPVVEALALGSPVIASDIPAMREAGGGAPEYLDPLDGPAWLDAVLAYAHADSPRRRAQLARMEQWKAPTWREHVLGVLDFIEEVAR